jgi:hypothetical protein
MGHTKEQYWFNPIYDECQKVYDAASTLKQIRRALWITGNTILGDQLEGMANELYAAEKVIRDQVASQVGAEFKASMQASRNMVNATLATIVSKAEGKEVK